MFVAHFNHKKSALLSLRIEETLNSDSPQSACDVIREEFRGERWRSDSQPITTPGRNWSSTLSSASRLGVDFGDFRQDSDAYINLRTGTLRIYTQQWNEPDIYTFPRWQLQIMEHLSRPETKHVLVYTFHIVT